jgi:hypothetical protein
MGLATRREQVARYGRRQFHRRAAALMFLVVTGSLALTPYLAQEVRAKDYVQAAASIHRNYLNGNVRLGIRSNSAAVVTSWVVGKVPFAFQLPTPQPVLNGKPEYRMAGASTVNYRGSNAALITYERDTRNISLLVASAEFAVVAGGEELRYGRLVFHYRSQADQRVITWTNHGLSYALVSTMSGSARGSCLVCHQNMKDRNRFIKKRIVASLGFRSAEEASRIIEGYEAMHLIRKGQIRWLAKGDWWDSANSSTLFSASPLDPLNYLTASLKPEVICYLQQIRTTFQSTLAVLLPKWHRESCSEKKRGKLRLTSPD